jgi:hypothetical protein
MNSTEYRDALSRLGVSINSAGRLLGFSARQSFRYAAGDPVPPTVVALLRAYLAHGLPNQGPACQQAEHEK